MERNLNSQGIVNIVRGVLGVRKCFLFDLPLSLRINSTIECHFIYLFIYCLVIHRIHASFRNAILFDETVEF